MRWRIDRAAVAVGVLVSWAVLAATTWAPFDDQIVYLEGTDPRSGRFAGWQDGALLAWWIAAVRLVALGADLGAVNLGVRMGVAVLVVVATHAAAAGLGLAPRGRAAATGLVTVSLLPVVSFSTDAVLAATLALWLGARASGVGPWLLGAVTGLVAASRPEGIVLLGILPWLAPEGVRRRVALAGLAVFAALALPGVVAGSGAWESSSLGVSGGRAWFAFRHHYVMVVLHDPRAPHEVWARWQEHGAGVFDGLDSFGEMVRERPGMWVDLVVAGAPWSLANLAAGLHGLWVPVLAVLARPRDAPTSAWLAAAVLLVALVSLLPAHAMGLVHMRHATRLLPLAVVLALAADGWMAGRWGLLRRVAWAVVGLQLLVNLLSVGVRLAAGEGAVWYVD